MKSRSDYWLTLHKLASDLLKEGDTDEERGKNLCEVLKSLTAATQEVYLDDLRSVMSAHRELLKQCDQRAG
jgi:hypothetical protein